MSPFNLADTSTLSEFVTQSLPRVSGRSDKKMPRHHQLNEALSAFRNPTSRPTLFLVPSSPKLCLHSRSHRGRIDLRIETCPSFAVVTKLRSARSCSVAYRKVNGFIFLICWKLVVAIVPCAPRYSHR
eukprot:gnl/TRDRNA2_/TRDRNA2_177880_c1_seq56.p1 gnl/TRDRNA2_/TRDRNA2_177880_c1~~gnl/TRDRNA2_/TRDRNA2_177880_c1_seq56.p1  ORF type:complete len:128 (+),score=2.59 gnl/TRDRNA2_/TRDRNA2_177880_c1_seq56:264-647(+)